jgi:PAS domain S-box-containing protein
MARRSRPDVTVRNASSGRAETVYSDRRGSLARSRGDVTARRRDEARRLQALLADVDAVVWESDARSGCYTFVSEAAERLLGFPLETWLSREDFLATRLHQDDRAGALAAIAAAVAEGRPRDLEYRLVRRNGTIVWVRDVGRPATDTDGREVARGVMIDVSRQKLEEERHAETELRYRRLIEHLPGIVYTESVDDDDVAVVYVSPKIREILGIDPEEWIGSLEGWLARTHPDDRDRVRAANERSTRTGEPFAQEYRMIAGDGRSVWFHDESVLVRDDEGRRLLWQGVMLDVTEQRRAADLEDALVTERAEAEALREADEIKNTFLQAVSHDLRTPLAAILGLAETLAREDLRLAPDESHDLAARIASNARKLDRMVTDLLDLDRIGRGMLRPNLAPTDIGALVAALVAESDMATSREVTIDAPPVVAEVDPGKVERIVENLLLNAARHTPSSASIWVRVLQEADAVTIVVEDDGPGVEPELRQAVFEPFSRAPGGSAYASGVGIGLALVARFAELHGGRAWVEDRDGGGASFRVRLPSGASEPVGA